MPKVFIDLTNTDWKKLARQKQVIVQIANEHHSTIREGLLTGLIHFIDHIQDYAVDKCGVSEQKVFPFIKG